MIDVEEKIARLIELNITYIRVKSSSPFSEAIERYIIAREENNQPINFEVPWYATKPDHVVVKMFGITIEIF